MPGQAAYWILAIFSFTIDAFHAAIACRRCRLFDISLYYHDDFYIARYADCYYFRYILAINISFWLYFYYD